MAFETLEPEMDMTNKYVEFNNEGDKIEGNFVGFETDNWGHERITLEIEGGFEKVLPGHADLRRYNKKLEMGDYIRVTLIKIQKSNNENYSDKKLYKVEKDPSRKVEYEIYDEGDEDYDY